jgi:tripartite-type tricarboxylate transporter receptor subunit TctC
MRADISTILISSDDARTRRRAAWILSCCAFTANLLGNEEAAAQTYPTRPIRFIVPYPAGGPADILGRVIGQKLTAKWSQQVVVDNRAGANTIIGMELTARAAPDGYTMILATTAMAINAAIVAKLPYDSAKDFTAITNLVSASFVLVVHPSIPVRDLKGLIALAKSKPGQIVFGSGGTGSPTHVSGELLKSMAGIDLVHVPYKGMAPALSDVLAGHISVLFSDPLVMLPYVKQGKVRALGVSGSARFPAAREIPTLAESGLPGYESGIWYGILAPAGMSKPLVDTLNTALVQLVKEPDVQERLASLGTTVIADSPEHFAAFIQAELVKWAKATVSMRAAEAAAAKN